MFDKHDRVLVVGLGRSGMETARVLRERGIEVIAFDDVAAALERNRAELTAIGASLVDLDALHRDAAHLSAAVRSPGVPCENAALALLRRAGVPTYAEIEIAYRLSPAPIIAVTGTKGKSTTTALIGHILRTAGRRTHVGGNIGSPLIRECSAAAAEDWVVAEVSSFQLEATHAFAPRISVILNLSPDHLDRYASMEAYAEAKYRIFANQSGSDAFIGNADDPYLRSLRASGNPRVMARDFWFSLDAATDGVAIRCEGGAIVWQQTTRRAVRIVPVDALRLRGRHNLANAMAAALATLVAGVPAAEVATALRTFTPLAHRFATVATIDGVTWIDDSKATNPDAVVKALQTCPAPAVLIAGGRGKETDFSALGRTASERTHTVILIGESARQIGAHIHGPVRHYASSLREAVEIAARAAAPSQYVLLSPGCASFDMFENAEQRGDVFASLVRELRDRTVAPS
ncbi:MAG: UDP-N-acetylmuramoyl-L-alanine--D-glutamate ligase [Candidatus Eremiobacteraeota bacterium]|nr:UDP-N-acetylmuramoyl-L-alanine--D-glutamate ligase [Candidatus Eremiobacteraeota bacterium]